MNVASAVRQFVAVIVKRLVRDRTALFFMTVLPVLVIVIIGVTFGNAGGLHIGVVDHSGGGAASAQILAGIDAADGTSVHRYDSEDDLRAAVRRNAVNAGVVLPADLDTTMAAGDAHVTLIALPDSEAAMLARDVVDAAVAPLAARSAAARLAAGATGTDLATATGAAATIAAGLPEVAVERVSVGKAQRTGLSQFSLVAPQNMVLFVFINSMASGAALVRMRRTGVLRRVLAGPGGSGTIVAGVLAAWVLISLLQSLLILGVGALLFDVDWGSPLGAGALVLAFSLVGAGAGVLVGALGGNEDRVGAITPPIGIVLGALGGCMVPLEVFSDTMRSVAHVTPQYWAMTGWQRLIFDGAGASGVTGPVLVLLAFATVFLGSAVVVLHRRLLRG